MFHIWMQPPLGFFLPPMWDRLQAPIIHSFHLHYIEYLCFIKWERDFGNYIKTIVRFLNNSFYKY